MLLGNKCDLEDKRVVSRKRGEAAASESGITFLETSAKTDANVERAFVELTESILDKTAEDFFDTRQRQNMPPSSGQTYGLQGCGCN